MFTMEATEKLQAAEHQRRDQRDDDRAAAHLPAASGHSHAAAAAALELVYSPILVHVPVPPVTLVWLVVAPSLVLILSDETVRTQNRLLASDRSAVVVSASVDDDVPLIAVPPLPTRTKATAVQPYALRAV